MSLKIADLVGKVEFNTLAMKISVLAAVLLLCVLPLATDAQDAQDGKHRVRVYWQ